VGGLACCSCRAGLNLPYSRLRHLDTDIQLLSLEKLYILRYTSFMNIYVILAYRKRVLTIIVVACLALGFLIWRHYTHIPLYPSDKWEYIIIHHSAQAEDSASNIIFI